MNMAVANSFQNPALQGGFGNSSFGGPNQAGAAALALAISINLPGAEQAGQAGQAGCEAGKAGKHGKNGKAGKHGKHGKHGKNGKAGKNCKAEEGNYASALHDGSLNIAMAGNINGGNQSQLAGLLMGLLSGSQPGGGACNCGANPGMGGYLNQFGRGPF